MRNLKVFIDICHKLYNDGYVAALDGNVSVRLDDKSILITPSAKCKGNLIEQDLIIVDNDGNILEGNGKISTESKLHLFAYKHRKDINAVIHAHPVYATAFAAMGEDFTKPIFPEVVLTLGKVHLCKYATPSTNEVTESIKPYIEYANALLLENHGAVTFGKNLEDAFNKMEKLEHTAKTISIIRSMGKENLIPLNKLSELYEIGENVYKLNIDKRNRMDI